MEIDLSSFERNIHKEKLKDVLSGNIKLMKWFNNKSIQRKKNVANSNKEVIKNFVYSNIIEQKVYGKAKRVYKCPIISKECDISLYNCENCRYLADIIDSYKGTQEMYDNKTPIYPEISIFCLGHVADKFDKILKENGVNIGENKAFKGGVSFK